MSSVNVCKRAISKGSAIAIVFRFSGLADILFDAYNSGMSLEQRNGCLFDDLTASALPSPCGSAIRNSSAG